MGLFGKIVLIVGCVIVFGICIYLLIADKIVLNKYLKKGLVLIEDENNPDLCKYNNCLEEQYKYESQFIYNNNVFLPWGCRGCKFGCCKNQFNEHRIRNCMCYRNKCVNFDMFSDINFNNIDDKVIQNNVYYYIKLLKERSKNINKII